MASNEAPQGGTITESVELDGDKVEQIKEYLNSIELNQIERIKLELEAPEPVLFKSESQNQSKSHTTDKLVSKKNGKGETENGFQKYTGKEMDNGPNYPPEELPSIEIKTGTQRFYTAVILHRSSDPLNARQIEKLLDGTKWEIPINSLYNVLSDLKKGGAVEKATDREWKAKYKLTEAGEKAVKQAIANADGYPAIVADKATGKAPA